MQDKILNTFCFIVLVVILLIVVRYGTKVALDWNRTHQEKPNENNRSLVTQEGEPK